MPITKQVNSLLLAVLSLSSPYLDPHEPVLSECFPFLIQSLLKIRMFGEDLSLPSAHG